LAALKRAILKQGGVVVFVKPHIEYQNLREWSTSAFAEFLVCSGFNLSEATVADENATYLLATVTASSYAAYLKDVGLDECALNADLLLVSTEDSSLKKTGGIGTYVAQAKRANPCSVVLFAQVGSGLEGAFPQTLLAEQIIGHTSYEQMFEGDGLLEAVRVALYTLPSLSICEFHDYQSIGFRLVQAKKCGGLPGNLTLRVFLHGNHDYIKNGARLFREATYSLEECKSIVRDKFIFANADESKCPSRYLYELMTKEYGYELKNCEIRRLPFDTKLITRAEEHGFCAEVDEIVFIGKYMQLKGWPDFVQAIASLGAANCLRKIRNIYLLAPGYPDKSDVDSIAQYANVQPLHLGHSKLLDFLAAKRARALFVVPSGFENYPNVFLECLLSSCRIVGYRSGGAVEVVNDDDYLDTFFSDVGALALGEKIRSVLRARPAAHEPIVAKASAAAWHRQLEINASFAEKTVPPVFSSHSFRQVALEEITVCTPVFNTPIEYLHELANSIKVSTMLPTEWLLVDDGSSEAYYEALRGFIQQIEWVKTRIVRQENKGLAGARNRGLRESKTSLIFFIDSDDVLLPHALAHSGLAMSMQEQPTLAVSGFAVYFESAKDLPSDVGYFSSGRYWKPLGVPEARTLALAQNEFITANSLVNREVAVALGGWDESDKSLWEDYAFYLKATWTDKSVLLFPWPACMYRVTPGSMARTYNKYLGIRRLVRNLPILSKPEANILVSLSRGALNRASHELSETEERLKQHALEELEQLKKELLIIYQSRTWRIAKPLRACARAYRGIFAPANGRQHKRL
jgi:glycosyltransferase involved in cell wall biosynthesis